MDFFQINTREVKGGGIEIYPDFVVGRSKDLMIRGRSFYAIWDDAVKLWSTDEYDVQRLVDEELDHYASENGKPSVKHMRSYNSNGWNLWRKFVSQLSDNSHPLDEKLTFANSTLKKTDYASRRLPYNLASGDHSAWDELVSTLYSDEERAKIEWSIGTVISGDSKKIQKFLVFYGPAGTGKSTILNIIQKLFDGYTTSFEAKALGSNNGSFATEVFRHNPLVAIQHDGDLSKIEDNTRLNSIISHEDMTMNEKYKPSYTARINAILLMGTNQPVRISDAKSGIIRRLIDVHPTGTRLQPNHYNTLMSRIDFELGAIAQHCLDVYRSMGKNYYNSYRPIEMMFQTDIFFNFVEATFDIFKAQDGVSLRQAYALYKEFCSETGVERPLPQYKVRSELQNYFAEFHDRVTIDGNQHRSYYKGFTAKQFKNPARENAKTFSLVLEETKSLFDLEYSCCFAQGAKEDGTPKKRWTDVKSTLSEIDTSELHYVKVPVGHVVIDFDIKDDAGDKSLERNLEAASLWPPTYAELSKSGAGVHLHYTYDGDVSELAVGYSDGIEVKTLLGNSSLRRRLTKCNNIPVATISTGLPLKGKKLLKQETVQSERGLRELILRNLRKEIHPGTAPSIDFIKHILDESYNAGMQYDVTDLRARIIAFANNSTHQGLRCLKAVQTMKFKGPDMTSEEKSKTSDEDLTQVLLFDVEVYPNLFVVCWKKLGDDAVIRMVNPSPQDIEALIRMPLIGFYNRRYDNHILYARYMGYDNEQLYKLSKRIIENDESAMFGEAYGLSHADIYDFSSKKQGLKKFEIDLGILHMELDLPWDEPVDPKDWDRVVEYCVNDVRATEAVFISRAQDYVARQILAELSGLTVNDTTQKHTARIIFGDYRNPQKRFVYTDLSKMFPGYRYDRGKSTYRDEVTGEGGYVYAEPGLYENVALLDVASMHPTSLRELNLFGDEFTRNFGDLVDARLAVKHQDYEAAKRLLGGKLAKFVVGSASDLEGLAHALKIIINIVYGLTSAKFDNPFRDLRNVDNIVAKRGALFMIDLKHAVQERGFTVAHIKTDSIKIPNATPEIIKFVMDFGARYGYMFEHEATYKKFCLVNNAVYIAKECKDGSEKWHAVGAQFQHPYVFKTLFSEEQVTFDDLCEAKTVTQGAMYLDFDYTEEKTATDVEGLHFVGKTGLFVPVHEGFGGGQLYRVKDGRMFAVSGTKGYLWVESSIAEGPSGDAIDMAYFERLARSARATIEKFGDFETFVN